MISKQQFSKLQEGDFILTRNRVRPPSLRKVVFAERHYLTLERTNEWRAKTGWKPNTTYTYSDIGHKIIGVWRFVKEKPSEIEQLFKSEASRNDKINNDGFYKTQSDYDGRSKNYL